MKLLTATRRTSLVLAAVFAFALATTGAASATGPDMAKLEGAGWHCALIAGDYHCLNPAETPPASGPTATLLVFDYPSGAFLGTERLMRLDLWQRGTPPCPQDMLLFLPFGYVACHHYDQTP